MKTLKRILGVLLIFLFGVFIGAAISSAGATKKLRDLMLGGPEAVMPVLVKRLDRELKLDEQQRRKLQAIMDDAHIRLRQSRAKIQPEMERTLIEAENRTRAILYPHQIEKFDEFVRRGRQKWKEEVGAVAPVQATPPPATPSTTPPASPATPAPAAEAIQ